jgi:peptide/nickel transport system permease protein
VTEEPHYEYYDSSKDAEARKARREELKLQRQAFRRGNIKKLFGHPLAVIGMLVIVIITIMAVIQPILIRTVWKSTIYDPQTGFDPDMDHHPSLPSHNHLLGTDALGRDVLSQLMFGARTSLGVGMLAGLVAILIALVIGVVSAYYGGWIDNTLMSLADIFLLMPPAIITLIVGLVLPMTWVTMGLLFGILAGLGSLAITFKSQALTIRIKPYVESSRLSGASGWHIMVKHILPGMLSVMMVSMMFVVSQAMMIEALISFYQGSAVRLSWGTMIWFIQSTFYLSPYAAQWNAVLPPALAITLLCASFYMVGRALDEILNPRLRER